MRHLVLLSALLGLPSAVWSADLIRRDPACQHIATVQYLDCEVSVLYSCPAVAGVAGPLIREESHDASGFAHFEVDTANGGMVVTGDAKGSYLIHTDLATLKETPLAEVMRTGAGRFSSDTALTMFGVTKPARQKITVAATGDTPQLSGVATITFTANVAMQMPPPMGETQSTSKAYLVPSLGIYLAGEVSGGTFFQADRTPHRPMSLILPGQAGFDATKPVYCGGSLSLNLVPNILDGVL
jgi:hypothetical protein